MLFVWPLLDTFAGAGITDLNPPIARLDFVNEIYTIDGATYSDFEILGGGYTSLQMNPGGMRLTDAIPDRVPAAIGDLLDEIVAGMTGGMVIVAEIVETRAAGEYFGPLFVVTDTDLGDSTDWLGVEYESTTDPASVRVFDNDGTDWTDTVAQLDPPRVTGIAALIAGDNGDGTYRYGLSVNGGAPVHTDIAYLPDWMPPGIVHLFGLRGDADRLPWDVHVRAMKLYSSRDISALQELSSVAQPALPVAADPAWSNVKLLVDFDGVDGATAETDVSGTGHALTFVGDAALSDAVVPPFGATTALALDGTGDRVTIPAHSDFVLGSNRYAIEAYVYPTEGVGTEIIIGGYDTSDNPCWELALVDGVPQYQFRQSSTQHVMPFGSALALNAWAHLLVVDFLDGRHYGFIDGAVFLLRSLDGSPSSVSGGVGIGGRYSDGASPFQGYIGPVRTAKGSQSAVQDSPLGFQPRTVAFPTS